MATIKLKAPSGGSVSLVAGDTVSDVVFTIPPTTSTIVTSDVLAAPTGSSLVGYMPDGVGGVATTVQDKLRESVSVKDFGAAGDGITDDTQAFIKARQYCESKRRVALNTFGNTDARGSVSIHIPGGAYLVTQGDAFLTSAYTTKTWGIAFQGEGSTITEILYRPAVAATFCTNNAWLGLRVKGIRFVADTAGCDFMNSIATHAEQDVIFDDVIWDNFATHFKLTGTNNNSEFRFNSCFGYNATGPFIDSIDSDQFLNYWFFGFKWWGANSPIVRMTKGGHVHFYGVDASAFASTAVADSYLIELLGSAHGLGACSFTSHDLRVEAKSTFAKLLKCEWTIGTVSMYDTDWSSQTFTYTYGDIININLGNADGPAFLFKGGSLAGGVYIVAGSNSYAYNHSLSFENVEWRQKAKISDIVTYSVPTNNGGRPVVKFRNCLIAGYGATTYQMAMDADIGARYAASGNVSKNILSITGNNKTVLATFSQEIRLPLNAIVTKFSALAKAGGSVETGTATYELWTTDTVPVLIAQAAFANPSLGGTATETATALPHFCDTEMQANLTVKANADVANQNTNLNFFIEYIG